MAKTGLFLLEGCAPPDGRVEQSQVSQLPATVGDMSERLEVAMTQTQVLQAIGYRPNSVDQETCGATVGAPWPCRVWTYEDGPNMLAVDFQSVQRHLAGE
jgi:hypothetical protein